MQIVIDVDDKDILFDIKNHGLIAQTESEEIIISALYNGTPLPKGHGRLIDEKDVIENICEARGCYGHNNCKSKLQRHTDCDTQTHLIGLLHVGNVRR